jgi:undecaprenyl-diphosphatase
VITTIGSPLAMPLIVLAWAGIELAWKRRDRALVMIASLAAAPIFYVLKAVIHRSRPETKFVELQHLHSYSFPSGHATMSFAVLLTLAYLLSLRLPRLWSRISTAFLIILVLLIGISRVYLGAHYPTDVIGGWLIGGIVLLAIRYYVSTYEHIASVRMKV